MTGIEELAGETARGPTPRALIVTVYGLYARQAGGFLPVAGLVRLLAELSVDGPAVRSAISRLKRRGLLESRRVGGVAGYALSDAGREVLREGDERIFTPPPDGERGWLLAVFSVPEAERRRRHTLRARLSRLGFGTAAPGVWVAPAHRYQATADALRRLGLDGYVDLFRADYLGFDELATAIRTWWDLPGLARAYDQFSSAHRPVLDRWRTDDPDDHRPAAFADWVRTLTAWRRLPYLDPGLPADLLPADWPAPSAAALLAALGDRLADAARTHVHTLTPAPVPTPTDP